MDVLSGKVAVVTGGAGGIGFEVGRVLAQQQMKVVLADFDAARLAEAVDKGVAEGLDLIGVETDVSDYASVKNLADRAFELTGEVDVVHLNAGISGRHGAVFEDTPEDWQRVVGVNLFGVVWGIKAFVPRLLEQSGESYILATTSGAGSEGTSYNGAGYAATKIAVMSVMESLYGQLRDRKSSIHTGLVFPPLTATNLGGSPENMKAVEEYLNSTGVPSAIVQPEQVAHMVLDGVRKNKFFINSSRQVNEEIFGGAHPEAFYEWKERIIRGRAEQQLTGGTPDSYLW